MPRCAMRRCSVLIAATSARASRSACACACGSSPAAATLRDERVLKLLTVASRRRRPFPSQSRRQNSHAPACPRRWRAPEAPTHAPRASVGRRRDAPARRRTRGRGSPPRGPPARQPRGRARDAGEVALGDRSSEKSACSRAASSAVAAVRASAPAWRQTGSDLRHRSVSMSLQANCRSRNASSCRRCRPGAAWCSAARRARARRPPCPASGARDPARDAARGRPWQVLELRKRPPASEPSEGAPSAWSRRADAASDARASRMSL